MKDRLDNFFLQCIVQNPKPESFYDEIFWCDLQMMYRLQTAPWSVLCCNTLFRRKKTKIIYFFRFKEWATPVIERANKIALTTTEQIVKKDYSLDPDENRMRSAAHNMVRNLTSGMAMITCRDHLLQSIKNHLKHFMVTLGRNLTQQVNCLDFQK